MKPRWTRWSRRVAVLVLGVAIPVIVGLWIGIDDPGESLARYPASLQLQDREGHVMRILLGPEDLRCDPVSFDRTGEWAGKALIAAEDKRFPDHPGVDVIAILRACGQNLFCGEVVSGASTLSTQVIRLCTPRRRTLWTKLLEATQALKMERVLNKRDILEQYLNRIPMGGNLAGLQSAGRRYFGKNAVDLNLAEASLLAGLPQSPSRFRPDRHMQRAVRRRAYVLERMEALGYISSDQRQRAEQSPIAVSFHPAPFHAPHFCNLVLATAESVHPRPVPYSAHVRTTLDPRIQQEVKGELARQAPALRSHGVYGAAVVVIEVKTGAVRALVGSLDYNDLEHAGRVNVAVLPRSPGSALKPFAYALAFDRGIYTPDTVVPDVPTFFSDYLPRNFDLTFAGPVTVRRALIESLNIPALRTVNALGLEDFTTLLRKLGIRSLDQPASHYGLSLVLGTAEVTLLDLTNAYACLARLGEYLPYRVLEEGSPPNRATRVFSDEAAYLVATVLGGDERQLSISGHAADCWMPRFAWKTGTSNGYRDAWTIAYNPEYAVGVWVGNPDGRPAPNLIGVERAAPIAAGIFRRLYPNSRAPWFKAPSAIRYREVCAVSGAPPNPHCPRCVRSAHIAGVSDPRPCTVHRGTPDGIVREVWPEAYAAWRRAASTEEAGPRIVSPQQGSEYRIVDTLPSAVQTLNLEAVASTELYWFIDGELVGRSRGTAPVTWPLRPGRHTVACTDAQGRADRVTISVDG